MIRRASIRFTMEGGPRCEGRRWSERRVRRTPSRRTAVARPRANGTHGDSQGQRLGFVNAKPICPNEATCVGSMYHSPPEGIVGTLCRHPALLLNWFRASEEIYNGGVEGLNSKSKLLMKGPTVSNPIKRLKSPWSTSSESILSPIQPANSIDEAKFQPSLREEVVERASEPGVEAPGYLRCTLRERGLGVRSASGISGFGVSLGLLGSDSDFEAKPIAVTGGHGGIS